MKTRDSWIAVRFLARSIGTLNHLLWGDTLWMSRFDGGAGPDP